MRMALGLVALLGVAVGSALLVGNNQASVTFFWTPYRVDLSLNLFLLLGTVLFIGMYLALRAIQGLTALPRQARLWRLRQQERAMHADLVQAQIQLMAGRYVRARNLALAAIEHEKLIASLNVPQMDRPRHAVPLRVLAHCLAAESAHALHDTRMREFHLNCALQVHLDEGQAIASAEEDAALLSAARWALGDKAPQQALSWLAKLPLGSARRVLALRLKLKAARQMGQNTMALETAHLLAKHGVFAANPARSLLRELTQSVLDGCHDQGQLTKVWNNLDAAEQATPDIALHAASRLLQVQGDAALALRWVQPIWRQWAQSLDAWPQAQSLTLVQLIETALEAQSPDTQWLTWLEQARLAMPRHRELQYLAAMVCLQHGLWGKAQQLLAPLANTLTSPVLQRKTCLALAQLAQRQGDDTLALAMWQKAAGT